jgi:hypothetical protein
MGSANFVADANRYIFERVSTMNKNPTAYTVTATDPRRRKFLTVGVGTLEEANEKGREWRADGMEDVEVVESKLPKTEA